MFELLRQRIDGGPANLVGSLGITEGQYCDAFTAPIQLYCVAQAATADLAGKPIELGQLIRQVVERLLFNTVKGHIRRTVL